jgi:hypothetical protein
MISPISTHILKPIPQDIPKTGSVKTVPLTQQPLPPALHFRRVFQTSDQMKNGIH